MRSKLKVWVLYPVQQQPGSYWGRFSAFVTCGSLTYNEVTACDCFCEIRRGPQATSHDAMSQVRTLDHIGKSPRIKRPNLLPNRLLWPKCQKETKQESKTFFSITYMDVFFLYKSLLNSTARLLPSSLFWPCSFNNLSME